ncbi:MAG: sensor histidine kinase [Conexibacter sp.]|nr:sensor histidine kinase [Conexibacter sp.]
MTLRHRIAAVAGGAVAVTVLAAAAVVFIAVRSELRGQIDTALRARAAQFVTGPDPDHDRGRICSRDANGNVEHSFPQPPSGNDDLRFGGAEGYAQVVCPDGTVVRATGATASLPVSARAREIARRGAGEDVSDLTVRGTSLRVLTLRARGSGALQVARPLTEADNELERILVVLAVVAAAGIALAAGLGALVARTALAPVSDFTRRSEALARDPDVTERMAVRGDDELARLARSFNTTLDALERSVDAQRHLVADASHELRTPIASLRANIQTLDEADRLPPADRAALRADIVAELDELTALVGDVVELARGSKRARVLDDVRLDRIVEALVERARARAVGPTDVRLALEPTVVRGEPDRLERAVSNLLDNAIKWSPPGGVVELELRDGTLSVRDHGPGFDAADLPHVFERFFRADRARGMPGSGLGLAIVRQAAEAHGGRVEAANAAGGGALMRVRFGP